MFLLPLQVYNTLCRVFPRRFVLPLNVDQETPYGRNLNPKGSATSVRFAKNKVGRHQDPNTLSFIYSV